MSTTTRAAALALMAAGLTSCGRELRAYERAWEVKSGDWRVEDGALVGKGGVIMSATEMADLVFEVDVDCPELGDRTVGIGFRQQPREPGPEGEKKGAGYGFNFTGTKTYNVFKGSKNTWTPVNPAFTTFQPSPVLDPGKNHIAVRLVGRKGDIDVNGKRVMTYEDSTFMKGRISFWVESTATTVRFSNIHIGKPPNR